MTDASTTTPGYAALEFPDPPRDRPYVIVNMVSSADGKTVIEETEQGLGSDLDQRLMRELRVHADVVLNGASTLRTSGTSPLLDDPALEEYRRARGRPDPPVAAIVSASGDLPLDASFFTSDEFRSLVFLGTDAQPEHREALESSNATVVIIPSEDPLPWILKFLRTDLNAQLLLVEGGASLNGQLFDAGLVDEFFLTLSPRVVGGRETHTAARSDRPSSLDKVRQLALLSAVPNTATGEVYLRYRVAH